MFFSLLIKGFFIGIAFIIPGLSGGTLAVYLGIYDKLLHAIGHIFDEFKKSVKFLIPVFIGIAISVVALAKLFSILLNWNSFIVLFFFIGLMLGGVKHIYSIASKQRLNISAIIAFLISFGLIILLVVLEKTGAQTSISQIDVNFKSLLVVFFVGMAASMTMIVPGISGSALLLVLGFYTAIVSNVIGNILDFSSLGYHIMVLAPFALGALVGIILFSKVIEYCLKHYKSQTYAAILGFILASCVAIFFEIKDPTTAALIENQTPIYQAFFSYIFDHLWTLIGGIGALIAGFFTSKLLTKTELKKD